MTANPAHPAYPDIAVSREGRVAIVEIRRPPNNFFDRALIMQLREAFAIVSKAQRTLSHVHSVSFMR